MKSIILSTLFLLIASNFFAQKFEIPSKQPFFADTIWQGAADPTMLWNPVKKEFYVWYTQRRANLENNTEVEWMHGSSIGIAASKDGKEWRYVGICKGNENLSEAKEKGVTWWAPSVIYDHKLFHMYVSYVPGIFRDWNAKRFIKHFTSTDGENWKYESTLPLSSERCIDACVYKVKDEWFLAYKDENNRNETWLAKSKDLYNWKVVGSAVGDVGHEAPYIWQEKGKYFMIVDAWEKGLRIYQSNDGINNWTYFCTVWGSHPGIFQLKGKTYIVYHSGYDQTNGKRTALFMKELIYKDNQFVVK